MKFGALFGWGIVIYAVMSLVWSIFVTYGFVDGLAPRVAALIVLVGVTVIAGLSLRYHAWHDILPYSLVWAAMMALLDGVVSVPYTGFELYTDVNVWIGYALVVFVPLFAPRFHMHQSLSKQSSDWI